MTATGLPCSALILLCDYAAVRLDYPVCDYPVCDYPVSDYPALHVPCCALFRAFSYPAVPLFDFLRTYFANVFHRRGENIRLSEVNTRNLSKIREIHNSTHGVIILAILYSGFPIHFTSPISSLDSSAD